MKEVKSFYLYKEVYEGMQNKENLSNISKRLNTTIQRLEYYAKPLKTLGIIKKTDVYGMWEITGKFYDNEVKKHILSQRTKNKLTVIGKSLRGDNKKDHARGHAFQLKLQIPNNYRNWGKREEIFDYVEMDYKPAYVGGIKRGQTIFIDEKKVDLYDKTIVITLSEDIIKKTVSEAKTYLLAKCFKIIKKLERKFNNSPLGEYGKYKFRVTRQHYGLIKNSLAKQYLNENKRLQVYNQEGSLWLLVDNSFSLEELETVHPDTADIDGTKVQEHFNVIKSTPVEIIKEMSPTNIKTILLTSSQQIKQSASQILSIAQNNKIYGDNSVTHVALMKEIRTSLKKIDERDERFLIALENLSKQ